ncbi:hypothetical protein KW785_01830 [Candidatus Parcubacteria bacterium]|nr:hypothetical protein [Candidatus Parcubacteria bacterium]
MSKHIAQDEYVPKLVQELQRRRRNGQPFELALKDTMSSAQIVLGVKLTPAEEIDLEPKVSQAYGILRATPISKATSSIFTAGRIPRRSERLGGQDRALPTNDS